jgi:hypothetical protein
MSHLIQSDQLNIPESCENAATWLQQAIDKLHAAGGGRLEISGGRTFTTGSLQLKDHVELHLQPGARLLASPNIEDHEDLDAQMSNDKGYGRGWIWARDANDISITGTGVLDGNSRAYTEEVRPERTVPKPNRFFGIVLLGCSGLQLRNIRIEGMPSWALRPAGCENVLIDGITLRSDINMVNTDGIDLDACKNVRVANCDIRCGDDGICIKTREESARRWGSCENVLVSNCVVQSSCTGIKIGTETHANIRDVTVTGCQIKMSHRGLGIDGRDDALIENVLYANCTVETHHSHPVWWHEGEPIYICPVRRSGEADASAPAQLRNIRFQNILIRSESGAFVLGSEECPPESIVFDQVRIEIAKHSPHPCGFADPRPCAPDFEPPGSKGRADRTLWGSLWQKKIAGFYLAHVNGVRLSRCEVKWIGDLPEGYGDALETHHVENLDLEHFTGQVAHPTGRAG